MATCTNSNLFSFLFILCCGYYSDEEARWYVWQKKVRGCCCLVTLSIYQPYSLVTYPLINPIFLQEEKRKRKDNASRLSVYIFYQLPFQEDFFFKEMVLFSNTIKDPLFEKRGEKEKKLFTVYGGLQWVGRIF